MPINVSIRPAAAAPNPNFGTALPTALPESNGTTFYVATTGNDTTGDGSIGNPWATMAKAAATLTAGQRCLIRGGSYGVASSASRLVFSTSGTAGNMISFEAYPGETVICYQNLRITGSYVRIRGIIVERNGIIAAKAGNAFGWDTTTSTNYPGEVGIWCSGSNVHLDKLEVRNQRWSGMLLDTGSNFQMTNCWIHNNGSTHDDHGIYCDNITSGLIANCIIERNADFGIQFYPSPSSVILTNCDFIMNGSQLGQPVANPYPQYVGTGTSPYGNSTDGSGIIVNSAAVGLKIVNCIEVGNCTNGIRSLGAVTSSAVALLSNHLAFDHPNGGAGGDYDTTMAALGVNLNHGDPKFTTPGSSFIGATGTPGDYHLGAGSPAIGAGLDAYTPQTDYYGNVRVTADLGAIGA